MIYVDYMELLSIVEVDANLDIIKKEIQHQQQLLEKWKVSIAVFSQWLKFLVLLSVEWLILRMIFMALWYSPWLIILRIVRELLFISKP